MEERKNKLSCDDRNKNIADYCHKIYKESLEKEKFKDEYIPKFMKKRKQNDDINTKNELNPKSWTVYK